MHPYFPDFGSCLQLLWILSQVDFLPPCHSAVLLKFYLVPSSRIYFSTIAFDLNFYLYAYVTQRELCSSALEKWPPAAAVLYAPAVHAPLITQGPETSWSQGRFWPVSLCRVPGRRDSACPLLGGASSYPSGRQPCQRACLEVGVGLVNL